MSEHASSEHSATNYQDSDSPAAEQASPTQPPEATESAVSWYDIHIANRQFTIASRKGEAHVRALEKLIGETVREMEDLLDGQGPANTALLIALNLADQLQTIRTLDNGNEATGRMQALIGRLASTLDIAPNTSEYKKGEHTTAMYEKLEFF